MRNGYRVIDADRHLMEPSTLWEERLDARYRDQGRTPVQVGRWSATWIVDGVQNNVGTSGLVRYHEVFDGRSKEELERLPAGFWTRPAWRKVYYDALRRGFSPEAYIEDLDRSGIDAAVCFGTAMLYFNWRDRIDQDYVAAVCRAYNDWISDYCRHSPERLFGIASVPMHDPKVAAKEAQRAVEKLGLVGLFVRPNPLQGRAWHDPSYDYFYDAVESLGKPLCFHEGASTIMPQARLPFGRTTFARHAMSHPFEQMLACLSMTVFGVLERHPRLKVLFAEATCGWVPFWLQRLDALASSRKFATGRSLRSKPSEYFRSRCAVTTESGEETIPSFLRLVGEANLFWASDYPHPDEVMKFPDTVQPMVEDPHLMPDSIRRILWDNPNAFFGLGLSGGGEA